MPKTTCSECGEPHFRGKQRYCEDCHAAYMRKWRKTHPLNDAHRKRDIARSHACVGVKRGVIERMPCEKCGESKAEMHHPDHELPRVVVWLCRPCHLAWHAHWRQTSLATFKNWLRIRAKSAA